MKTTLTAVQAAALVRRDLDETVPNGSVMYTDTVGEGDNTSLDDIIARTLPEAVDIVHLAAPVHLLDWDGEGTIGEPLQPDTIAFDYATITGKVLQFSLKEQAAPFLRLIVFKATDSPIAVTDVIPEASPEGRKQLNPDICGQYDRPRLVMRQGLVAHPDFWYYSLRPWSEEDAPPEPGECIERFEYIPMQAKTTYTNTTTNPLSCYICNRLKRNIIDQLTGMVLTIYGDQRAQTFLARAAQF